MFHTFPLQNSSNYMHLILVIGIISFTGFNAGECANILIAAEYGAGSHFLAATRIGKGLVSRGHDVTLFISRAFQYRTEDPDLANHFSFELFNQSITPDEMSEFFAAFGKLADYSQLKQMFELIRITQEVNVNDCDAILSNHVTMGRLREANYSAILFDLVWPCGRLVAAKLGSNITTVGLLQTIATSLLYQIAGIPIQPAYVPEFVSGFPQQMTFLQRMQNALLTLLTYSGILCIPTEDFRYNPLKAKHGIRPDVDMRRLLSETDLWLHNVDNAVDFPTPGATNVIPVGGLTTQPAQLLEQDLEEFMQSSQDHGVIIFTLGTYLTAINQDIIHIFIDVMNELDQKIVWHMPDSLREKLTFDLPKNVKALPWIPQNDLLGHTKTRIMIFHGGNNGMYEAVYHAIPMIVIPIYADQYDTATRVSERGLGLKVARSELTKDRLLTAVRELLFDSRYKETAQRTSAVFRDRPQRPVDRGAFWVEHVIKYNSTYMRTPVHDLSFFQLHLLDVIAFLTMIGAIAACVIYKFMSMLIRILKTAHSKEKSD